MPLPSLPELDVPYNISMSSLILPKLEEYGDQLAITEDVTGRQMKYREFVVSVKQLSAALLKQGILKGDVVSICAPNCIEHILLFYALARIGGIFHGINAIFSEADILYQLEKSGTKYMVTDCKTLPKVQRVLGTHYSAEKLFLVGNNEIEGIPTLLSLLTDAEANDISDGDPDFDARQVPFTIIYTSGTTGMPKAVVQSQYTYSYNNFVFSPEKLSLLEPGEVSVVMLPFFHAFAQMVVMTHFMYTAVKLVLIPNGLDFPHFVRSIDKYKATTVWTNPPVVLKLATDPVVSQYDLSSVKTLVFGGAPVRRPIIDKIKQSSSTIKRICQLYGLSETGFVSSAMDNLVERASVGILLPGASGKIMDLKNDVELGPNKKGELLLRTPGLMLEYKKDPENTAQTIDKQGWLHTGDVAYYEEDGSLYVTDRVKDIINYREGKIYPSSVDTLLIQQPEINDVATIGLSREGQGEIPYSFIVQCPGRTKISEDKLKTKIKEYLSFPAMELEVEFVEQIPRNPAGKPLMQQLRQWAEDRRVPREAFMDLTLRTT